MDGLSPTRTELAPGTLVIRGISVLDKGEHIGLCAFPGRLDSHMPTL